MNKKIQILSASFLCLFLAALAGCGGIVEDCADGCAEGLSCFYGSCVPDMDGSDGGDDGGTQEAEADPEGTDGGADADDADADVPDLVHPDDADAAEDSSDADDAVEAVDDSVLPDAEADVGPEDDIGPEADVEPEDVGGGCSGGWLDMVTDLCWQDPPDAPALTWIEAYGYCSSLSLGGYGPGSWRMPTLDDLRTLIRGCPATATEGACGVGPGCYVCETGGGCWSSVCDGCSVAGGPGALGCYWDPSLSAAAGGYYWTSTECTGPVGAGTAWAVNFGSGAIVSVSKTSLPAVRCVRTGP